MAVILTEGFDLYSNSFGFNRRAGLLSSGSASTQFYRVTGRFGGGAVSVNGYPGSMVMPGPSTVSAAAMGCAFRRLSSSNGTIIMTFFNGIVPVVSVYTDLDGFVMVVRGDAPGANLLGKATRRPISSTVFAYVECEVVRHATAGQVRVWIDNDQVLNLTGLNTGASDFNGYGMSGTGSLSNGQLYGVWDDLYVCDTAERLGPARIETLSPTSDVTREFVPNTGANNYSRVAEQPTDLDSSFVSTATDLATDGYRFSTLLTNPLKIHSVAAVLVARTDDVTPRIIRSVTKSGANTANGPQDILTADYQRTQAIMPNAIGGTTPWTKAAVDALISGPQMMIPA